MKVVHYLNEYSIQDENGYFEIAEGFRTIEALENHIKLMLIAVQNYKGVTLQEDDIVVDDEPIDYSARYYHE